MSRFCVKKMVKGGIFVLLVFMFSLLIIGTVFADDGVVPQEPVENGEVPSSTETQEMPVGGSVTVVDEPAEPELPSENIVSEDSEEMDSTETLAETFPDTSEEVSQDESVDSAETAAEEVVDVAQAELLIVNDNGEPLDMASQESLETVSSGDPWWMVGAVKYAYVKNSSLCPADTTLGTTCFVDATTPIKTALQFMDNNNLVPTDGILHIEPDTYNETTITIDGSAGNGYLANLKGLVSEGTSDNTVINADITISNTLLGFTLSGFTINGRLDIHDNSGPLTMTDLNVSKPTDSGIVVTNHNGAVAADRVMSDGNYAYGMYVDNTAGTYPVTITNSEFSHNDSGVAGVFYGGLEIHTNSTITLNGVSASSNHGNGVKLDAVKGTTVKNGAFNNNFAETGYGGIGYGLYVYNSFTTNQILLENVQADGNSYHGICLVSSGNVTLKNINAFSNGASTNSYGVSIDNRAGTGTVSVTNSTFKENGYQGLWIFSHGNVTLNGITALGNHRDGVIIDNCDLSAGVCLGTGSVTISGSLPNYFSSNLNNGLVITSGGNVTLSYFQANENLSDGVNIINDYDGRSGNVTVNLTYTPVIGMWLNTLSGNQESGLIVYSNGNILVDKCVAEGNVNSYGAYLDNDHAASAKTVTVKNSSFHDNLDTGLLIASKGNVLLNDVDAYQNTNGVGVNIQNQSGSGSVTISGSGTTLHDFSNNGVGGINIYSAGVVTIKNVYAGKNPFGLYVDNTYGNGKAVSVSNADFSDCTSSYGLGIYSKGAINLMDVVSNRNSNSAGADLNNVVASSAQVVKITRGQFDDNPNSLGLSINSLGTVTLNSVQAMGNGGTGVYIDVCQYDGSIPGCKSSGGVVMTGTGNNFSNNGYYGLEIIARGSVTLNNVTADNNASNGLVVNHLYDNCNGNITLNATSRNTNSFSGNGARGIFIGSLGSISLSRFDASNNATYGAYVSNYYSLSPRTVMVSYATLNDNQGNGLAIYSTGTVTLSGVQTLRNTEYFIEMDDDLGQIAHDRLPFEQVHDEIWWFEGGNGQGVTIDLSSTTFDAYLEFFDGDWYLLDADDNGGGGTDAQISYSLSADGIYYIRVTSAVEGQYGQYILSINGSSPYDTYAYNYGVFIDNSYNSGTGDVRINKSSLGYGLESRDNNYSGLYIYTNGNIAVSNAVVSYNGGYNGAEFYNDYIEGKSVTLSNSSFDYNDWTGISITSKGAINWSGGGANHNLNSKGAGIGNSDAGAYKPVTISNATFNENIGTGLEVVSLGNITLTNVSASGSFGGSGAVLDNCRYSGTIPGCRGYGNVTLSGTYGRLEFNDNYGNGLDVYSRGLISLTNVNAGRNDTSSGLHLMNDYVNANGNIIVKTSSSSTYSALSNNGGFGLEILSRGTISLSNLNAFENSETGITVLNYNATTPKTVTLARIRSGENSGHGIYVSASGAITASYIDDSGNTSNGIVLSTSSAGTPQSITVSRTKIDGNTAGNGLDIAAAGSVTLNNISSTNNRYGAVISNTAGPGSKVTVLSSLGENVFSNNTFTGLRIYSSGDVSLSKVTADVNGEYGVDIQTDGTLTVATMRLYRNSAHGLSARGDAGISINSLQSYNNGSSSNQDGINITVDTGSSATISNSVITGNYGDGIEYNGGLDLVLVNTCYFGNDINGTGNKNLNLH